MGTTESQPTPQAPESDAARPDPRNYEGTYRTSRGAQGWIRWENNSFVFQAEGRVPFTSTLKIEKIDGDNTWFSVPSHPRNAELGKQMVFLHNKGKCTITEQEGQKTVWTFMAPMPADGISLSSAATTAPSAPGGMSSPPIGTFATVRADEATSRPIPGAQSATREGAAPVTSLRSTVLQRQQSVQSALETLRAVQARKWVCVYKGGGVNIRSEPSLAPPKSDLGSLQTQIVFNVSEEKRDPASGVTFLKLADRPGWVFDKIPNQGTVCQPVEASSNPALAPAKVDRVMKQDLSKLSQDALQKALEETDALHGEIKEQIHKATAFSNNAVDLFGSQKTYGLRWEKKWEGLPFGPDREDIRERVRDGTKKKVAEELGLRHFGAPSGARAPPFSGKTLLFIDGSQEAQQGFAPSGGPNLLGRYDVVLSPAKADFDRDWRFISGDKKPFWVVHAAGINIGESKNAADFPDFCRHGALDKDAFLQATGRVVANIVRATSQIMERPEEKAHLVFFPFGMGAFLRHLPLNDPTYTDERKMQDLRRAMTRKFAECLGYTKAGCQIHLCLGFTEGEAQLNSDAFLRAWDSSSSNLKSRTTVWPDGDSLQLAHELATKGQTVFLVNGANRRLLGNHWFGKYAKRAIDENMHRRSWLLSATSYMLNGFGVADIDRRRPDDLKRNIELLGGRVFYLDDSSCSIS